MAKTTIHFNNYSEEAVDSIVEQSVGKPVRLGDPFDKNAKIGTVISAKRIEATKSIEFECEIKKGVI